MSREDIMKRLRGPKGTKVRLGVVRNGIKDRLTFNVTRDKIPVKTVDAVYMIRPEVGYIRIGSFGSTTHDEFMEGMKKLARQGMKKLVLDLQKNGGGYLQAAVQVADEFLHRDDMIVYTDGRQAPRMEYKAKGNGTFTDGQIAILVDSYTASAAEIVTGAIQDHDRGIVIGRRTYGKGLVQRPFDMPDGSMIRLTVAHYYTPSGRCIQKSFLRGDNESYEAEILERYNHGENFVADSADFRSGEVFTTVGGRKVYGGGGIMPDVFVPADTTFFSPYYRDLVAKGVVNQYCLGYVDRHRAELLKAYPDEDAFIARFEVTPEMEKELIEAGERDKITYNDEQWQRSRPYVLAVLKGLLTRDLYEEGSYFRAVNPLSPDYREALRVISDDRLYRSILDGTAQ